MGEENSNNARGAALVSTRGIIGVGSYLTVVSTISLLSLYYSWPRCSVVLQQPREVTADAASGDKVSSKTAKGDADQGAATANANGSPANNAVPPADSTSGGLRPKMTSISPTSGQVDAQTLVTVRGSGFQEGVRVAFGGISAEVFGPVTEDSITVVAPPHHPAKVDVLALNPNGSSDSLLAVFQYTCPPIEDANVLWLAILAGALGGSIHAMRSLYWYAGNRQLCWSWVPMYILLPFSGAAIATVFFLIARGGFLSTAPEREMSVVIIAIAGLTGLFSQQAALKLQDIANAVLTKPEPGTDSKPQARLAPSFVPPPAAAIYGPTISPDNGGIAGGTEVRILGTGFSSVESVSFGRKDASEPKFDPKTSSITAKSPPHEAGEVDVIVTKDANNKLTLKYRYV